MTGMINLLPWRQHHRHRRVRLWSLAAIGCLLIILLTAFTRAVFLNGQQQQQRLHGESLSQLQSVLQRKQQALLDIERQQHTAQRREARRQSVKDWESWFIQLAAGLPASVWFNTLSVADGKMHIKGNAATPEDMQLVEAHFQNLSGITTVQMGEVSHHPGDQIRFAISMSLAQGGKNG